MGGRESTGPLNLPLLRRWGGGPPGQGGEIVQGRAQARAGSSTQRGRRGRYPHPQQNWVVKNLKLDFNKTNRKGYVQNRGGFNPKGRVRELFSPPQQGALAGKGLRVGVLSHRAAAHFPWGRASSSAPRPWQGGAAHPLGRWRWRRRLPGSSRQGRSPAQGTAARWRRVARSPPGSPPAPHRVPHPAPRQPGGGVSQGRQRWWRRLAPGRGGGGEEEKRVGHRPARPALWPRGGSGGNKTFPARGRGRGGQGRRTGSGSPGWAGPSRCPQGRASQSGHPAPFSRTP